MAANVADLPLYVAAVMGNNRGAWLESTKNIRKLLSIERDPPIKAVVDAGVVPRLVAFLRERDMEELQFEAAWALTNVASGTPDDTCAVVNAGAVPVFVQLLASPSEDVMEQAVWALGNIAGDSWESRDVVLSAGALPALIAQLKPGAKLTLLRHATWALSNFCRGQPPPNIEAVRLALAKLAELVFSDDEEVLTDACWALWHLCDGPSENIQAVFESGVIARCIELLMHHNPAVKTPALRTVGNIVTGDDAQTQTMVEYGTLVALLTLLGNERKGICEEACWTISNITAGSREQIQAVMDGNIVGILIHLLDDNDLDIKKQAAWAIVNAIAGGSTEQIRALVEAGVLGSLSRLLDVDEAAVAVLALVGVTRVLEAGRQEGHEDYADMLEESVGLERLAELKAEHEQEMRAVQPGKRPLYRGDVVALNFELRWVVVLHGPTAAAAPGMGGCGISALYRCLFCR